MVETAANPALTEKIPAAKGAYVLMIALGRSISVRVGTSDRRLAAGLLVYAGSARGPGGLRARLARHLRSDKRNHWHVDQLTSAGRIEAVAFTHRLSECELVDRLRSVPGATIPLPGFGSSDCRRCRSHLVRIPDGFPPVSIVTAEPGLVYLEIAPATGRRGDIC